MTNSPNTRSPILLPKVIQFEGLELPIESFDQQEGTFSKPVPTTWKRVQFSIPDGYTSAKAVEEWLKVNCPNRWASYHYQNPKQKAQGDRVMVVRFEDKNDALLFKLRGGHQAWEQS